MSNNTQQTENARLAKIAKTAKHDAEILEFIAKKGSAQPHEIRNALGIKKGQVHAFMQRQAAKGAIEIKRTISNNCFVTYIMVKEK